jgi:hypothetical protein
MTSSGSTGPERHISSIRMDGGTSTELALGRKLAEHFADDRDLLGRWMAFHLAELVSADQHEPTVEQRLQIVDIVLRIWTLRHHLPVPPLEEFASVLAALERLGESSPWAFSRLGFRYDSFGDGWALASLAQELEQLTRETLVRLLWLSAHKASEQNEDWLALADEIGGSLESGILSSLSRLRSELETAGAGESELDIDSPEQTVPPVSHGRHHISDQRHATKLRLMAKRLNDLADELAATNG